jgi:hypothetical protein
MRKTYDLLAKKYDSLCRDTEKLANERALEISRPYRSAILSLDSQEHILRRAVDLIDSSLSDKKDKSEIEAVISAKIASIVNPIKKITKRKKGKNKK